MSCSVRHSSRDVALLLDIARSWAGGATRGHKDDRPDWAEVYHRVTMVKSVGQGSL
jgi:hypothetical protein